MGFAAAFVAIATPPLTEQAVELDRVWTLFLVIAGVVGAIVGALIAWSIVRYGRRADDDVPSQRQYHVPLELTYTVVPLLLVVVLFVVSVRSIHRVEASDGEPDLVVQVTGFQWQWQFDYPAAGARSVGVADTVPELALPADSTVRFELTSRDVIHSFWVPGLRFKRDLFPGETSDFQVDVGDHVGFYEHTGSCAEFCGLDHARMRFSVRILSPQDFDAWLADHQLPGRAADEESS
jgi:cytochrome c oxidase subunit 2